MQLSWTVTNLPETIALQHEAVEMGREESSRRAGVGSPDSLAASLLQQNQPGAVEAALREMLAREEKTDSGTVFKLNYQYLLGDFLLRRGRYAEAEPLLRSAYLGFQEFPTAFSTQPNLTSIRQSLLLLYQATGQTEQADRLKKEMEAANPTPPG